MTLLSAPPDPDAPLLPYVKLVSGMRIEEKRKRDGITQEQLAKMVGIGTRWLREIEGGNPKSRIDDHIKCAHELGLSTGHITIPLLFLEHERWFPPQLLLAGIEEIERKCIDFIAEWNVSNLAQLFQARLPNDRNAR